MPATPDIEQPIDGVAHHLGRDARFFGHREIGRAGGGHQNRALARLDVLLTVRDGPGSG